MDVNELLLGVDCKCGKKHTCNIKHVYIEAGACKRLVEICAQYSKILIVADQNTFGVAGKGVESALSGKIANKVIFDGDKILIPNEQAIERVEKDLKDIDIIVGIGSGVIQDLCKYVSFDKGVPYIIVATAPSMDGYASTGAAMILGGMKVTVSAGLPLAIVADVDVLKNAPMEMIKSGYGDIIGKYSSLNDWKLSNVVTGEYFCQYIYDVTYQMIEKTKALAQGVVKRDAESIKVLMEALTVVGIMMSFATTSRPASGSEHHLSHFFEIVGIVRGEEYFPHGIDVAYSTIETALIREKLLKQSFNKQNFRDDKSVLEQKIKAVYGEEVGLGCIKLHEKLKTYATDRQKIYVEKEQEIKKILSEMPTASEVESILNVVGYDKKEFYALYGEQKIKDAIVYAKDLKDRYTVLWLNYDINGEN